MLLVCRLPVRAPSIRSSDAADFLVEIDDFNYGFPLISGPEEVVRQFCRHWGHPVRKDHRGRVREVASIALVYSFVSCPSWFTQYALG
jgi:hypothetical protein